MVSSPRVFDSSPLYFFFFWRPLIVGRMLLSPGTYLSVSACLSHNSICACKCVCLWVCVCVSYHLQVNLQITGRVCLLYISVSLSACVCVREYLHVLFFAWCVYVCVFSLGNRQVPLQSQTAGCSPQSLTPWYPAEEDAPPVVCWSPGLSCQSPYDTAERDRERETRVRN